MTSFLGELRRRNVVRVAVAYAIVSWLLVEISSVLGPALLLPPWVTTLVAFLLILGFPVALVLSWAYELTPDGVELTDAVPETESIAKGTGRKFDVAIIGLLVVAVGFLVFNYVLVDEDAPELTPVIADQPAESPIPAAEETLQGEPANSLAVLAFEDLSPEGDQEYFSDGISEELLNLLADVEGLRVPSRTSSFSFKGSGADLTTIAAELNVTHVLEGSVRKAGNQIRITAQLIEAATDTHLWSENYTRELTNVFDLQDEIAANVVEALRVELLGDASIGSGGRITEMPEAHDAYLLGRHSLLTRRTEDLLAARDHFRRAIELDPDYAAPYVGLADSYTLLHIYGVILLDEVTDNAEPAIERALQLDPEMGQAYTTRGWVVWQKGDWAAAEEDFGRAIALSPNYAQAYLWYANLLSLSLHRLDEAVAALESALALDPLAPVISQNLGFLLASQGDSERGLEYLRRANELAPTFPTPYAQRGTLEAFDGRLAAAHRLYRTAASLDAGNPYLPQFVAYSYVVLGDLEESQHWFDVSAERFGEKPVAQLMHDYIPLVMRGEEPERLASITALVDNWDLGVFINFRPVGSAHLVGGNLADARALYVRFFPELFAPADDVVNAFNADAAVDVAWILRNDGEVDQADELLNQALTATVDRPTATYSLLYLADVRALAMLGRETAALAALRERIDDGWRDVWWLTEADPTIASIVDHPEFLAMVDEVKTDITAQLELVREMERNGEFEPAPEVAAIQ